MKIKLLFLVGFFGVLNFGFSQDGELDITFSNNGYVLTNFFNERCRGYTIAQQNNNEIVVAGSIEIGDDYYSLLTRYLPDGELDTNFGEDGLVTQYFDDGFYSYDSLIIQNDAKILAGSTIGAWGEKNIAIVRYLPDGELDSSFGENGIIISSISDDDDFLKAILLQEDGKIIAISRSTFNGDYQVSISRYQTNGELDISFGTNGIVTTYIGDGYNRVFDGNILDNGNLVISATIEVENNDDNIILLSYLHNGDLDPNFGNNGIIHTNIFNDSVFYLPISTFNENKFLIAFGRSEFPTGSGSLMLVRFLANGEIDTSFGENGTVLDESSPFSVHSMVVQADNEIVLGGGIADFEGTYFTMRRYNENGEVDSEFEESAFSYFESAEIILQNDERILAVGNTYWYDGLENIVVARFNNNPLGVEDFTNPNLKTYPNPSNGIFNLILEEEVNTSYHITDITGKVLQKGNISNLEPQIDLSFAQNGVYFLNTDFGTFRLVKD